jgi:phosphoglycolate phosphatase
MTQKPAAIIFDFDGTLIDSAHSVLASIAQALEVTRIPQVVPLGPQLIGPPLRKTLATVIGSEDPQQLEQLAAAFRDAYDQHGYRQTEIYAGVAALLETLHSADIALFIATNKRILPTRRILEHLGWQQWFAGVYALDALTPPAAHKRALVAEIIQRERLDAAASGMCGDSAEDQQAATSNALRFFAAAWGYGEATSAGDPLHCLTQPLQLLEHAGLSQQSSTHHSAGRTP